MEYCSRSRVSRSGFELSPYAEELSGASCRLHNVFWLTTRCRADMPNDVARAFRHAMQVASLPKLAQLINAVEPAEWNSCKTEGIDLTANVFWIDDKPTPRALAVLAQHGCEHRWIEARVDHDPVDLPVVHHELDERLGFIWSQQGGNRLKY